jgi:hypothetical protein
MNEELEKVPEGSGLFEVLCRNLRARAEENHEKPQERIACVLVEIRAQHLSNISFHRYSYANWLAVFALQSDKYHNTL